MIWRHKKKGYELKYRSQNDTYQREMDKRLPYQIPNFFNFAAILLRRNWCRRRQTKTDQMKTPKAPEEKSEEQLVKKSKPKGQIAKKTIPRKKTTLLNRTKNIALGIRSIWGNKLKKTDNLKSPDVAKNEK